VRERLRERERESSSHCTRNEKYHIITMTLPFTYIKKVMFLQAKERRRRIMETQIFHHAKI
jgi:hypothetical protein